MSAAKSSLWPLITTLISVALEVGNYDNRPLANVLWVVCAVLWLAWLSSFATVRYQSPEQREFNRAIDAYERLGIMCAQADALLLRIRLSESKDLPNISKPVRKWTLGAIEYLREGHSLAAAEHFTHGIVDRTTGSGVLTEQDALRLRTDYLRGLMAAMFAGRQPLR